MRRRGSVRLLFICGWCDGVWSRFLTANSRRKLSLPENCIIVLHVWLPRECRPVVSMLRDREQCGTAMGVNES